MASRVVRFTRPPWDSTLPGDCHDSLQPEKLAPCGCSQRRAAASLKPYRKQMRRKPLRAASQYCPCRSVPCNSPSSNDVRDSREICCDPDTCDCPTMTHGFSRCSSRRTSNVPPTRRRSMGCTNPIDFECGYLRPKSDCDCIESEPRPPFVVRRVDSKTLRRTPGLAGGSRRAMGKKRRSKAVWLQPCDCCKDVRVQRAPRFVERCTVCDTYERYMGKPYWGHRNGCHPVGLKQIPVEVTRSAVDDRHKYDASRYDEYTGDELQGTSCRRFDRPNQSTHYNANRYADTPAAASQSYDDLTERIEQALRISSSGLSADCNTDQSLSENRAAGHQEAGARTFDVGSAYRGAW